MGLKRILFVSTALCSSTALAQSFLKPPDVAAYSAVTPLYKTDGTANTPIDPAITAMPIGLGLTNIPIPSSTNRIVTTSDLTPATFTGSISTTVLTVSAFGTGKALAVGDEISGSGVATSTKIASLGTGVGGTGTYNLTVSQTVASESMGASSFNFCLTPLNGGNAGCGEAKFRTQADEGPMLPDDPIRNYGQPAQSHLHGFFGGGSCNAYTTYKTARAHALASTAAGTDANGTCYWRPEIEVLNPYSNGKNYALKANYVTIYYTGDPTQMQLAPYIPIGLRYVFGFDMDAASTAYGTGGQYAWLQTAIDTANLASGHARYQLTNPGTGLISTAGRWTCTGATPIAGADTHVEPGSSKYLAMGDGSDPFGGTCPAGDIFMRIDGAQCYDGTNLWSSGGYKHFIPTIYDNDFGQLVCPYNYYRLPLLTLEFHFTTTGAADYTRWVLSSDLSYRTAHSLTASQLPNGSTFHTDWLDGWDQTIRNIWEINCIGSMHHTPHQCDSSQISATQELKGGGSGEAGAGGRNPQIDTTALAHTLETDPGWMLIPPAWSGAMSGMTIRH